MKKWIISIVCGLLGALIMYLIFIYFIIDLGHVDGTPVKKTECVFPCISAFVLVTLLVKSILSDNNSGGGGGATAAESVACSAGAGAM